MLDNRANSAYCANMPRGRRTRALTTEQISRLEEFRTAAHDGHPHGYTLPELRTAIGARFGIETLQKALAGLGVWENYHSYLAQWIERYLPAKPVDGAAEPLEDAAREADAEEATKTDGTLRGSR